MIQVTKVCTNWGKVCLSTSAEFDSSLDAVVGIFHAIIYFQFNFISFWQQA